MLKALMLRKKINDAKKDIEALRAATADFEAREAELQKREAEIAEAIEEASTEEEQAAVAEAVESYEADDKALKDERSENDQKIADLENEVAAMEAELAEVEEQQRAAAPVATPEAPVVINHEGTITITEERTNNHMFKTRSINSMTMEQRTALVAREDVKKTLSEIRTLIKENGLAFPKPDMSIRHFIARFASRNVLVIVTTFKSRCGFETPGIGSP